MIFKESDPAIHIGRCIDIKIDGQVRVHIRKINTKSTSNTNN
jgi:hypothetical protein